MLKLEADKMKAAIERAKAEHLKVKVISVSKRTYAVTGKSGKTYTVRFSVTSSGVKLGECDCPARTYCKHLAAGAQANILCQSFRERGAQAEPSLGQMAMYVARNTGWML